MKFTEEELKALYALNEDELVEGMLYVNSPEGIEQARQEDDLEVARALQNSGNDINAAADAIRSKVGNNPDPTVTSRGTGGGARGSSTSLSSSFGIMSGGGGGAPDAPAAYFENYYQEGDVEEVDEPYVDEDDAKEAEFTRVFALGYNQGMIHGESNAESEYEELTNQAVDDAEKMHYRLGEVDGYQRGKDETILNMQNNVVEAFTIGQNSEFGEGDGSHEVYDRGYTDGIKDARAENIVEYTRGRTVGFNDGKDYIIHGGWWDGYEFHPDPDPRYEATVDIKVKEKLESLALRAIDAHERGVKEGEAKGREKGFAEGVDYIVHTGEYFQHSALYDQGKKDGRAEGADYWYEEGFIQGRQGYIQALVDDVAEEAF